MTRSRLAGLLGLLFVALALPSSILVYQAYGQLKWEAFYQHQQLARDLAQRIDADFRDLIEREEQRPISDYEFLNVAGGENDGFLQRSPLSNLPPSTDLPGLLGYFQVDASGRLRTPLVPDTAAPGFGISAAELGERRARESRIRGILDRNRLVGRDDSAVDEQIAAAVSPAEPDFEDYELLESIALEEQDIDSPSTMPGSRVLPQGEVHIESETLGQSAFDQLISRKSAVPSADRQAPAEQVSDLKLEDTYSVAEYEVVPVEGMQLQQAPEKRSRKEKVNLPRAFDDDRAQSSGFSADADNTPGGSQPMRQLVRIETFESEVEPMTFALLDSGHFVLFRRVWHRDERYIQGILFEQQPIVDTLVEPAFRQSTLASMSRLIVAYRGGILRKLEPVYGRRYEPRVDDGGDELLYQSRLIAPFGDVELVFTLASLPLGAGARIVVWSALVLALVLIGGFVLLYQLGLRQLTLARQQQDFVSAVSHELKTPLTSIRMYGEMLREGWADETKRKSYYDFIFHEAERLTRLINNVLQLARMSRNEQTANLVETSVADALAGLRPRLESQLDPTGFRLVIDSDADADAARISIDDDGFVQIFTNLVDNAIKFSAAAETREVHLTCRRQDNNRIRFAVRDFGPGIAPGQMKKIFRLFYRAENELTRETVGTGIGLALVQQLASAMAAEVDVANREPGAEFQVSFPVPGTSG